MLTNTYFLGVLPGEGQPRRYEVVEIFRFLHFISKCGVTAPHIGRTMYTEEVCRRWTAKSKWWEWGGRGTLKRAKGECFRRWNGADEVWKATGMGDFKAQTMRVSAWTELKGPAKVEGFFQTYKITLVHSSTKCIRKPQNWRPTTDKDWHRQWPT